MAAARKNVNYEVYIERLFKKDAPDVRVSAGAVTAIDQIIREVLEKISVGAGVFADAVEQISITDRSIRRAAETILKSTSADKDELQWHAENYANNALQAFKDNKRDVKAEGAADIRHSRSERAGLIVSVARVEADLREKYVRVYEGASVFLAAILELIIKRLIRESKKAAVNRKSKTVHALDVLTGIYECPYDYKTVLGFAIISEVPIPAADIISKMHHCTGRKVKLMCDRKGARAK